MPENSFLRFENDECDIYLPILELMYRYESNKISGSHGGGRRHSQLRWKRQDMLSFVVADVREDAVLVAQRETRFDELIERMVAEKHLMQYASGGETYHATRVGELVRNITCLHEFQERDGVNEAEEVIDMRYSIMDGIRWEPRLRFGPARDIPPERLAEALSDSFEPDHVLPNGVSLENAMEDFRAVLEAYRRKFGGLAFTEFQADSIVKELSKSWYGRFDPLVLTAGTGMGKTIAFSIPVITDALIQNRTPGGRKCSQILLYPRNDLAKDQFKELQDVLKHLNYNLISQGETTRVIGIALDADGLIKKPLNNYPTTGGEQVPWNVGGGNVYNSSVQKYAGNDSHRAPAAIVACSIESFRRRLRIPEVLDGLARGLQRIVSDEVHLCSSTQGAHVSNILKRCQKIVQEKTDRELTFMGVSATIAKPRRHVAKIWFGEESREQDVRHVDADRSKNQVPMGLLNHILVKDRQHASTIGSLVDLTSAVIHHRRHPSMERPTLGNGIDYGRLQKTIGFADSHEIVGNWYSYMLDNEVTSAAARMHNENTMMRKPYNQWHDAPLSCHEGGSDVCKSCRQGSYAATPIPVPSNIIDLIQTERLPDPSQEERFELKFSESPTFDLNEEGEYLVRGLDSCPHLESGTCWWFAPRSGALESRPGDINAFSFKESARVKRHTSKTQDGDQGGEILSADASFKERPWKGGYPKNPGGGVDDANQPIVHDLAIATPTLEVGVDMNNVTEVLTHKAIRNVSSYRQKVGRAGRERGTDALAVTLLSSSGQDFHHYRSMRKLVDASISDPVPLASGNRIVLSSEAYDAVFDYITQHPNLPSIEVVGNNPGPRLEHNIRSCMGAIYDDAAGVSVGECYEYVRESIRPGLEPVHVHSAIKAAHEHLNKLVQPVMNGEDGAVTGIEYIAFANSDLELPSVDPNLDNWNKLSGALDFLGSNGVDVDVLGDIIAHTNVGDLRKFAHGNPMLEGFANKFNDSVPAGNPFFTEVKELVSRDDFKKVTWYLSTLIRALPSMKATSPYISPETLFLNPHEAPLEVRRFLGPGATKSEFIPNAEGLNFALPGMWTHRLFNGERFYVGSGLSAIASPRPRTFRMQIDSIVNRGNPPLSTPVGLLGEDEHGKISPLLDFKPIVDMPLKRLNRITVQRDNGLTGRPNTVGFRSTPPSFKQLVANMDILSGGGFPTPKKRPNSFSISWVLAEPGDGEPLQTYAVPRTRQGGLGSRTVLGLRHPLMQLLFDSASFHPKMRVKRMAFGVSRSNDVVLVPFENGQEVGFVDEFTTHGLKFNVSSETLLRGYQSHVHLDSAFCEATLQIVGYWILTNQDCKNLGVNSFLVQAYLDALTDHVYEGEFQGAPPNTFPKTNGDFLQAWLRGGSTVSRPRLRLRFEQDKVADDLVSDFLDLMDSLMVLIGQSSDEIIDDWGVITKNWYCHTLGNTLGLLLAESVGEYSGVQATSVGYTYDASAENNSIEICVFDNEPEGNGACSLAKTYFSTPISVRDLGVHFGDRNLPSQSLVDVIERRCTVCTEHVIHQASISGHAPSGLEQDLVNEADELRGRYNGVWNEHELNDVNQAGLMYRRKFAMAGANQGEALTQTQRQRLLELELALDLCSQSCPSCRGDGSVNLFPVHLAGYVTNRASLDAALGNWTDHSVGYKMSTRDLEEIQQLRGEPCPSETTWHLVEVYPPHRESIRDEVHYPSPFIGLALQRNEPLPESLEYYVRVLDVV